MKTIRRLLACLLATLMLLSLTACSGLTDVLVEESVTTLVQGNLDVLYLGKVTDDYLESTVSTKEECLQLYEEGLGMEADFFASYFGIEYFTDELRNKVIDLYRDIYSHSNYTVGAASRVDDTTAVVMLEVQPIDLFVQLTDQAETLLADFYAKYTQDVVDAMTSAEYVAYDAEWAETIIAACRQLLPNVSYEETKSIAVQVLLQDEVWSISNDSMGEIDSVIIAYP